jgi:hypothetical protein
VRVGLPAKVQIEALGGTVPNGRVERFDVEMARRDRPRELSLADMQKPEPKVFDLVIAVEGVPEGLMPGLTGDAILELDRVATGPPTPGDGAAQRGAVTEHAPAGPTILPFPGYVDAVEKVALLAPTNVMGYVTRLAPQYSRVEKGGVVLEATGDMAKAALERVAPMPEVQAKRVELALLTARANAAMRSLEVEQARTRQEAEELRMTKLLAQPSDYALRMANASVKQAQLEHELATKRLEMIRAAGMDSEAELAKLELEAALAEKIIEEAKCRLASLQQGAAGGPLVPGQQLDLRCLAVEVV